MSKLFTLISILFLLSFIKVNAQSTLFEEGYIIQQADTIHGYIKSASDPDLSTSILFRTDLNTEAKIYQPGEITGFHLKGSGFYYATVKAEIRKDTVAKQVERFAKLLLRGYTDLYKLPIPAEEQSIVLQRQNMYLYVLEKESAYYTLGLYETLEKNLISLNKRYIGILRAVFNDCENYEDNLDKLSFDDKSIIAEVTKYNLCKNPVSQTQVQKYNSKPVIKHGLEGNYAQFYKPDNADNYKAQGYFAGYFMEIVFPDKSRMYSGNLGIGYMFYRYSYLDFFEKEIAGESHLIRIPLSVQYNFKDALSTGLIPFINVGLTMYTLPNFRLSDLSPMQSFGIGFNYGRMKYSFLLENEGLKLKGNKLLNFSIGIRLNK